MIVYSKENSVDYLASANELLNIVRCSKIGKVHSVCNSVSLEKTVFFIQLKIGQYNTGI